MTAVAQKTVLTGCVAPIDKNGLEQLIANGKANPKVIKTLKCKTVAEGKFRQDLLFRLNTVEIRLPPLRDRLEDIPILAEHFLKLHRERYRRPIMGFTPEALDALRQHLWPGNVRELDHVIERAVLMSPGNIVTAFDLALEATPDARLSARLEEMSLEDAERLLIKKALARFEGNANRAAEALGLSRSALYRRLQKYGLGS